VRSGDVNDDVMFIVIYRVTVLERGSPHSVGLQECGKVIFSLSLLSVECMVCYS